MMKASMLMYGVGEEVGPCSREWEPPEARWEGRLCQKWKKKAERAHPWTKEQLEYLLRHAQSLAGGGPTGSLTWSGVFSIQFLDWHLLSSRACLATRDLDEFYNLRSLVGSLVF